MYELSYRCKKTILTEFIFNKKKKVSFRNTGEELGSLAYLSYGQTNNSVKTGNK
jgi:hypothetical protein